MNAKNMFIINLVLTCLTCMVLIVSCPGCSAEQLDKAAVTTQQIAPAVKVLPPVITSQPWYVFVLLVSDIASSAAAAWLAYRKK